MLYEPEGYVIHILWGSQNNVTRIMGIIELCNTHDMSTRKLHNTLTCYDDQTATK